MLRNHCLLMFWITNILCFPFPDYARMEVAGMKVRGFIIVCQPPPERALSLSEVEEVEEKEEKEARKSFVTVINISPPINSCLHTHLTFKQCSDKTHIWKALNVTLDSFQMQLNRQETSKLLSLLFDNIELGFHNLSMIFSLLGRMVAWSVICLTGNLCLLS